MVYDIPDVSQMLAAAAISFAVVGGSCWHTKCLLSTSRLWKLPSLLLSPIWDAQAEPCLAMHVVEQRMLEQKVVHFRLLCQVVSVTFLPITLSLLGRIAMGWDHVTLTMGQEWTHILGHIIVTLVLVYPASVRASTVDFIYSILMFLSCLFVSPFFSGSNCDDMPARVLFANAFVFMLCSVRRTMGCKRWKSLVVWNIIFITCSGSSILRRGGQDLTHLSMLLSAQIVPLVVATALAFHIERELLDNILHTVQLQETKELHAAACALLVGCCEVVLELDGEGIIATPAVDLGSFLLRGIGHNLQGWKLADLISDPQDKESFNARLAASSRLKDIGVAENMQVRTRDGNNVPLHLELLWFQFTRTGQARYMVGIREYSDKVRMEEADDHPVSSSDESGSSSQASGVSVEMTNPVALVVDTTEPGFPIRSLTSGFRARIGRPPLGTPLAALFAKTDEAHEFSGWVQESCNDLQYGKIVEDRRIVLRMPQGLVKAKIKIMLFEPSNGGVARNDSDDSGLPLAHLNFYNIRLSKSPLTEGKQRPRHQPSNSSNSSSSNFSDMSEPRRHRIIASI